MNRRLLERSTDLAELPQRLWKLLGSVSNNPADPLSSAQLSTISETGPQCRILILRGVDAEQRLLFMHTDRRSSKLVQLRNDPRVMWLFYDHQARTQLRLAGIASLHYGDEVADRVWNAARPETKRIFLTAFPPGAPIPTPDVAFPDGDLDVETGRPHFAVIRTQVTHMDLLQLDAAGNLRADCQWQQDHWTCQWSAP